MWGQNIAPVSLVCDYDWKDLDPFEDDYCSWSGMHRLVKIQRFIFSQDASKQLLTKIKREIFPLCIGEDIARYL